MTNLFENVINEERINNLTDAECNMILDMFKDAPWVSKPIGYVTDGDEVVTVYKDGRGFITCDNMDTHIEGLAYWDWFSDIVAFCCEHNPTLCIEGAYMTDLDWNVLLDDDDDE